MKSNFLYMSQSIFSSLLVGLEFYFFYLEKLYKYIFCIRLKCNLLIIKYNITIYKIKKSIVVNNNYFNTILKLEKKKKVKFLLMIGVESF